MHTMHFHPVSWTQDGRMATGQLSPTPLMLRVPPRIAHKQKYIRINFNFNTLNFWKKQLCRCRFQKDASVSFWFMLSTCTVPNRQAHRNIFKSDKGFDTNIFLQRITIWRNHGKGRNKRAFKFVQWDIVESQIEGAFKHRKLSVFESVFVPIITCVHHQSWTMTERMLSQVQAAEMVFLRRVHGVTLRGKVRSCEIRKAPNTEPHPRIESSQLRWFGHVYWVSQDWRGWSCWLHPRESGPEVVQGPDRATASLTFLSPVLV